MRRQAHLRRALAWLFGTVVAATALAGCATSCSRARLPRERAELSDLEKATVAAFTSGTISRESAVRVAFHESLATPEQVGAPITPSPFRFDPAVAGTALWAAPDRIEFRPKERLPDGQAYAVSLDLRPLFPAGKAPLPHFDFVFGTMRQSFDVSVDGLEAADAADVKRQTLTGRLLTADVEDAPGVEKLLRATHEGRALTVSWSHDPDRRIHKWSAPGIERGAAASVVNVSWDGAPIGVDRKDSREVSVPGLDTFTVAEARAVAAPEPHVELRFTDPLKPGQNLKGLLRIAQRDDLRFVVDGSRVDIYGTKGWRGQLTLRVEAGVRNVLGYPMKEARELALLFEQRKPAVRFAGKGVIVPTSAGFTVPIETVNLRAVTVEALQIAASSMPQFLQVNGLDGEQELRRVGRVVWKKTLALDLTPDKENRWLKVGLDVQPLIAKSPGGMYRLTLSFRRPHVVWPCEGQPAATEMERTAGGDDDEQEQSYWDNWEEGEAGNWQERFDNRENPCHPAYYQRFYDHNIAAARNVLVSDLGLMAKVGEDDQVTVVVNDLRSTDPVGGADVTLLDYQQQPLANGRTDRDGFVRLAAPRPAFLATVRHGGQTGYLRMDAGSALPVAHFDVAGTRAPKGLKGFLYGERGIWRPGDTMHLTFVLHDATRRLAADHPVRLDLVDPRGQLVHGYTRTQSTDGFYAFDVATAPDAPTGSYNARVSVGGATFEKTLKVETVMPNRLKIAMDFGTEELRAQGHVSGVLSSAWLHGAPARSLKADVELALSPARTSFKRFEEYVFDDPTRKYETERQKIFEGNLDETGKVRIDAAVQTESVAPGKLRADLTTRVFEPGGAFSIDRFSIPYSPFARYVGIRTPRGDRTRGMLLTDTKHRVDIALLAADGTPAGDADVLVKLYKVEWRWWWEKGEEDLAAWAESSVHTPLQTGVVKLKNGAGAWDLEIKYPEWGRYLLVAEDKAGGHRAGRTLYIDWPGWAGRGQKEQGGGATVLAFSADKSEYAPGETVTLAIPTPQKGRGLVSLESGSRVLRSDWIEVKGQETRFTFTATAEMAPNIYAHVTLLQPHAQTTNDLPIRLYGIAPIKVVSPETRLQPVLEVPEVLSPEATSEVRVRESSGRPMTYTLAVVDEGLLGLTRFQTPNPWDYFYAREALAVRSFDLYDDVVGAFGAAMERMLAIGGDEAGVSAKGRRANRFPPMVRFLGPFRLAARATGTHPVAIPQYVGRRARDGGGRPRRRLRRGREARVRAPAADAARDAAARARAGGDGRAAGLGLRARAERQGRGALRLDLRAARGGGRGEQDGELQGGRRPGDRLPPAREARARGRERQRHRDVGDREGRPEDRARRAQLHGARDRRGGRDDQARRVVDACGRAARARGHEPRDARGLARPASRPGPAARVPDRVPARLPRADRVGGLPAALSREAPRAHARHAGAHRDQRQGCPRKAAPLPGHERRLRLLARRRRLERLGHELRGPLRARGAEGRLPAAGRARRPVERLPAPARAGLGRGRGPGRADAGVSALHAGACRSAGAAGNEPAPRAAEPARRREVAARRRLPARGPAGGSARPRERRTTVDTAVPGARLHLRVRFARPGDGARGRGAARPLRARRAAREEPLRVAVEERVAVDARDRLRAPRALEGRERPEGRGEDRVLLRVERERRHGRDVGLAHRGAPARRRQGDGTEARRAQHRHGDALPAAHPLGPAAGRARDRGLERAHARRPVPDGRRQAARARASRPGHRLQGRGEGHEHRRARDATSSSRSRTSSPRASRSGTTASTRAGGAAARRSRTRTCATIASTPTST